jgi:acetyl esterase/lipase
MQPLQPRTGAASKLSTFNDVALAGFDQGKVESVTYKGAKDADIQMWVVYPPGFDASRKYPVMMLLHGGPHNSMTDSTQWRWNAEVFASWGYVVTWHNFHGSGGFGNDFTDSINPDWITMPYEDTIGRGLADVEVVHRPDRMAPRRQLRRIRTTLPGRKHPFKALAPQRSTTCSPRGSDYGAEKPNALNSGTSPRSSRAIRRTARRKLTPTLIIHNQNDLRVPLNHGIELFNTLQRAAYLELVYFPDENHWVLKPQNSLFWYRTVRTGLQPTQNLVHY